MQLTRGDHHHFWKGVPFGAPVEENSLWGLVAMADTPSSSPFNTPFSSSTDTLSSKSTPPSSPDDSYTPTKKPSSRSKNPFPPVRYPDLPIQLNDGETDDYNDLSTGHVDSAGCHTGPSSPSDGKCSKRSSQPPGYDDAATGHPIHAWRNAPRLPTRLRQVGSGLSRMESGRHGKPSSETCISSEPDSISSPSSDTPDIEPSPSGPSCYESDDTRVSSSLDLFFVEDQSTESSPFDHKFETPHKKDGAEAGLSTTNGGDRPRSNTLGVNLTQRRDTPQGRSHSPVNNSFPPAISDIPGVHAAESVGSKSPDVSQPENDSIQTRPSHGSRHPKDLNPKRNPIKSQRKTSSANKEDPNYTENSLSEILPREMGRLFHKDSARCVAFYQTPPDTRCGHPNKGSDSDLPAQLRIFANIDISEATPCIEKLLASIVCGMHRNVALRRWKYWRDVFPNLESASNNIDDPRLPRLVDWFQALQDGARSLGPSAEPGIKAEDEQVDGPAKPIATLQQLIPWCPDGQKKRSINQRLLETCISPLTPKKDHKTGFIYICLSSGGHERMKIGCAENIDGRLRQLGKCEKGLSLYFPKDDEKGLPIPHFYRAEKLIQAELRDYRRELSNCSNCNKNHREWFEGVGVDLAADVARKWIDWVRRKPYVLRDYEGKAEWVLSDEASDSLKTVCKPHEKLRSGFFPTKR
ncbi:predicted protein [Aspergillus terreus NIH2624]|uniref:Bacteriophage T5 Orf172 DNA-binding domain-containing protein n=1 Tax=Aspergillus terreus (strain NIH 2624 / FGSC A1156) TaxID=341663 RepID=Q0CMQ7_ASPTN|nr:uncharacterized protein ATEG_05027 [Aspergillus terreus NIH2624]EAU34096.1 predicted protein [Aspergillus terreus NIH2624]